MFVVKFSKKRVFVLPRVYVLVGEVYLPPIRYMGRGVTLSIFTSWQLDCVIPFLDKADRKALGSFDDRVPRISHRYPTEQCPACSSGIFDHEKTHLVNTCFDGTFCGRCCELEVHVKCPVKFRCDQKMCDVVSSDSQRFLKHETDGTVVCIECVKKILADGGLTQIGGEALFERPPLVELKGFYRLADNWRDARDIIGRVERAICMDDDGIYDVFDVLEDVN